MKQVGNIFCVQPEICRASLPAKEIVWAEWWNEHEDIKARWERTIFFDPTDIYYRIAPKINPYKRQNFSFSVNEMFPDIPGKCACGCGKDLPKGRSRYATEECGIFCFQIRGIITAGTPFARKYIAIYYGNGCCDCENRGGDLDHVIPVKHGGGGCWLGNYRIRCHKCHVKKTKKDFGWKGKKRKPKNKKKDNLPF